MAKVSILIPIYNVDKFLKDCLTSIANQTYTDFEVLMIDDGSKDNSAKICEDFSKRDNRFKVRHQQNQGSGKARNNAIEWALSTESEYIAWVDADDLLASDYLELLMTQMEIHPEYDMIQCDFTSRLGELENGSEFCDAVVVDGAKLLREMLGEHYGVAFTLLWNKVYKKSLYDGVRVFTDEKISGRMQDDVNLLWQIYEKSKGCLWIRKVKYYYRMVGTSIQHQKIANKNVEFLWLYLRVYQKIKQKGQQEMADFIGERMLFELAKAMGHPKDQYANYSEFHQYCCEIYSALKQNIRFKCKRPDLKVLAVLGKINIGVLQIYGRLYKRVRG